MNSDTFIERSGQDRRSGIDRRMEHAIIERLDHFGISLSEKSFSSNGNERRKGDRRKGERRVIM